MGYHEAVPQLVELAEAGAGGLRLVVEGSDGHKTAEGEMVKIGETLEESGQLEVVGLKAGLGGLGAEFDFEQDGKGLEETCGGFVESLGETEGVDGIDCVEELSGTSRFVGLKMADEVDFGAGGDERAQARAFGFELLDAAFAEQRNAGGHGHSNGFGGVGLRDGHETDFGARATRAAAGCGDALFKSGQILGKGTHKTMVAAGGNAEGLPECAEDKCCCGQPGRMAEHRRLTGFPEHAGRKTAGNWCSRRSGAPTGVRPDERGVTTG